MLSLITYQRSRECIAGAIQGGTGARPEFLAIGELAFRALSTRERREAVAGCHVVRRTRMNEEVMLCCVILQ
jgi:hypothetical protein